jgi:hypothetical protein
MKEIRGGCGLKCFYCLSTAHCLAVTRGNVISYSMPFSWALPSHQSNAVPIVGCISFINGFRHGVQIKRELFPFSSRYPPVQRQQKEQGGKSACLTGYTEMSLLFKEWLETSVLEHQYLAPEWHSGLRLWISVHEASLQTLVRSLAVSQPAVIGSPIGRCTIGPALSGLGEDLARVGRHCKIRICS